jgi:type II secretory pathway pseudopilin PulG
VESSAVTRTGDRFRAVGRKKREDRGYVLLGLLLMVSVLLIAAAVVAPNLAFQIKRDREEELVHRGVQYTRAIRNYAKRTGRYPVRTEDLLGGPDQRFIRKLYKDPMTGGDFKLLHLDDVQPAPANLNPSAAQAGASDDGLASAGMTPAPTSSDGRAPGDRSAGDPSLGDPSSSDPAQDSSGAAGQNGVRPNALARGGSAVATSSNAGTTGSQPGRLIFGVVSTSKARSIREFNHKDHYSDWLFFYDPRSDRGYEIKGPTSLTPQVFPVHPPNQTQSGGPSQQTSQQQSQPQPQSAPLSQ